MNAHNGLGFETWIILKNLTCERNVCKIIKSGKGVSSMKVFNGYKFIDKNKHYPNMFISDVESLTLIIA